MAKKLKKRGPEKLRYRDPALAHAIRLVGGPAKLAKAVGVTIQAVSEWERCPPRRVVAVEAATGGEVSRERLCPEIFGKAA
jgi:DNA-binding transcriptional regulator YdaS (Cro superfamily)